MRWLFPSPTGLGAIGYGFDPEEIDSAIPHKFCAEAPARVLFPAMSVLFPGENWFYDCLPAGCGRGGDDLKSLQLKIKRPILVALATLSKETETQAKAAPIYRNASFLAASVWVHEIFHSFQQRGFSEDKIGFSESAPSPKACESDSAWIADLRAERDELAALLPAIKSLEVAELKKRFRKILMRRKTGNQACWNMMRRRERVEGTAHYVETETMRSTGLWSEKDVLERYRHVMDDQAMTPGSFALWYATGGAQCLVLDRLDAIGAWQKSVESGASLEVTLDALIGK